VRWVITHPGPAWSVHDVYVGWVEGLRAAGEQVLGFNFGDRLAFYENAVLPVEGGGHRPAVDGGMAGAAELAFNGLAAMLWKVRPDVLMVISGFMIPTDILDQARRYGTRVVVVHTEQPYELKRELALAGHADLNLLNDPVNMDQFAAVAPTIYAPHSYRPAIHHPGPGLDLWRSDMAVAMSAFGSRVWFFEQMHQLGAFEGRNILLAGGPWFNVDETSPLWPLLACAPPNATDNRDAADIYRSTKVGINLYRREHDDDKVSDGQGVSMGPREVEMAACGLFFLRDPRPEGDVVLPMLPVFDGPEQAAEQLAW
jgi:spore maturation protein CgeB